MITVGTLIASGIAPTQARTFAEPLAEACQRFDITSPARFACFFGQIAVESAKFTSLEEGLFYTKAERVKDIFPSRVKSLQQAALLIRNPKALANCVYAGKNGNGDEASGDGYRYAGKGLIQLTGRANYQAAQDALRRPYIEHPELVALPQDACLTAAWFWASIDANNLADSHLIDEITKRINGRAMLHADLRRQYTEDALRALS